MDDRFNATIEKIYAAASGEEAWEGALHSIEDLTGSVGAVIGFVPTADGHAPFNIAGRFTAEQCATYSQSYQPLCRRTRFMMDHPDKEAIYDSLLITEQEMDRDPVYEWFGRHGLRYFVGSALTPTQTHYAVFSLQRSPAQGHVQAADVDLFNQIKSHLRRAITLADQIGSLRAFQSFGRRLFEALPHAVFALDGLGRVLFANGAALALVRARDGLSIDDGRVAAVRPQDQQVLDALIAEALGTALKVGSGWAHIVRPSGKTPYAVFVAPLKTDPGEFAAPGVTALVLVHDLARLTSVDPQVLTRLYGLTDTEARLACAIAAGHSLETAAASLGMGVGTARSHLKHVFAKLGVNRQQDLVRLLTSLASISL